MKRFLFLVLLVVLSAECMAQFNQLILRKNGLPHRRYQEGSVITIETKTGMKYTGTIFLLQKDSVYFSGSGIAVQDISAVLKKKNKAPVIPMETEAFLYAHLGIVLFTAGLVISGEPFLNSFLSGVGLVYIPVLLYNIKERVLKQNRRYPIGHKYELQLLDLYRPEPVPINNR